MNLGVDVFSGITLGGALPAGAGLRPGGNRPEIEARVAALSTAMFESTRRTTEPA